MLGLLDLLPPFRRWSDCSGDLVAEEWDLGWCETWGCRRKAGAVSAIEFRDGQQLTVEEEQKGGGDVEL